MRGSSDPQLAMLTTVSTEDLIPKDHPFGTKRPCVDTGYYATFNRENVSLVDLKFISKRPTSVQEVNEALIAASTTPASATRA